VDMTRLEGLVHHNESLGLYNFTLFCRTSFKMEKCCTGLMSFREERHRKLKVLGSYPVAVL